MSLNYHDGFIPAPAPAGYAQELCGCAQAGPVRCSTTRTDFSRGEKLAVGFPLLSRSDGGGGAEGDGGGGRLRRDLVIARTVTLLSAWWPPPPPPNGGPPPPCFTQERTADCGIPPTGTSTHATSPAAPIRYLPNPVRLSTPCWVGLSSSPSPHRSEIMTSGWCGEIGWVRRRSHPGRPTG
jgi:hypothetical protein